MGLLLTFDNLQLYKQFERNLPALKSNILGDDRCLELLDVS